MNTENARRVVMAGMKLMYDEQGRQILMRALDQEGDVSEIIANEALGLMAILFDKSGHKIPPDAVPTAVSVLVIEIATFFKESGKEVSKEDVQAALQMALKMLPDVFRQLLSKNKPAQPEAQPQPAAPPQGGLIQQPAAMGA